MKNNQPEEKNGTGQEAPNEPERNLSFDKLFIDTKIRQFFTDRERFEKLKEDEISLEIIRRMIFQKSLLGYIDETKKPTLDFDPRKISVNTVLKLTQKSEDGNFNLLLPTFSDVTTRTDFLSKPREADLAEGTYINWFLVNFNELLTSVIAEESIFKGIIINPEEKFCEIAIPKDQAQLTLNNIKTLPPDIDNVRISNTIEDQVDLEELKKVMLEIIAVDKKIKRIKAFRFINKLSRGIGFIYEYDGVKEYDTLIEVSKYCSNLTDSSLFIWHALANVNDPRFEEFELIMDGNKFVKQKFVPTPKGDNKMNEDKKNVENHDKKHEHDHGKKHDHEHDKKHDHKHNEKHDRKHDDITSPKPDKKDIKKENTKKPPKQDKK